MQNKQEIHFPCSFSYLKGENISQPDNHSTLLGYFEETLTRHGEKIAIRHGTLAATYNELDVLSSRISRFFRKNGLCKGQVIFLYMNKSIELIASILGCLKQGLPFIISTPGDAFNERQHAAYKATGASVILTSSGTDLSYFEEKKISVLKLPEVFDCVEENNSNMNTSSPEDIAYFVSTSGSTGQPNYIQISHDSACHFIEACRTAYQITEESVVYLFISLDYDVCMGEILVSFATGATLCLPVRNKNHADDHLIKEIKDYQVSHIQLPPSALSVLPYDPLSDLKCLVVGGEATALDLVKKWGKGRKFYNAYGPAEAIIFATVYEYRGNETDALPIGKPVGNKTIYLFDEEMKPTPKNEVGEVYIAGWLSTGYLNNELLTQKKFIKNPLNPDEILYKTGDLAKISPEGHLVFVGRKDFQFKVNGVRIEPEEIEKAILSAPHIQECLVMPYTMPTGEKKIVAFLKGEEDINVDSLQELLQKKLPKTMIPSLFYKSQNFNYTPNGKIDRKQIPDLQQCQLMSASLQFYKNTTEKVILKIWEDILGIKPTSVSDSFFHCGGDSLSIVRLNAKLKETFGHNFDLNVLYEEDTIEKQANLYDGMNAPRVSA